MVDDAGTEARGARGLAGHDPDACLEPLPIAIDEVDEGYRHAERRGGDEGEIVERLLGASVENPFIAKSLNAGVFF